MSCCTNTYDLGCWESCETITATGITANATGKFIIRTLPNLADLVSFNRTIGQTLIIPNSFNEDGITQFQIIDPNGDVFTYTTGGVTYDCFKIKNRISFTPENIPVGADCEPATANAYNSDLDLLATASIPSGAIGNLNIPDTPASAINTAATVIGSANLPSGVAGTVTVPDFTLTINDQSGNNLFTGNKVSGVNITQAVTVDKSTNIQLDFDSGTDTSGLFTVLTNQSEGTYTALLQDGGSGVITISINGGAYASFVNPTVFVNGDTIQVKRTVDTNPGYVILTGTYT